MVRGLARRAVVIAQRADPQLRIAKSSIDRRSLLVRTRGAASWQNATVDLRIAPDVRLGRHVRVSFEPWSSNVLHIGAGSTIADNVLIQLKGGVVHIGERVEIRRGVVLNVAGRLELRGDNLVSWNTVVHCSHEVTIDQFAILAEQVTIADSSHYFTEPNEHFWHNVRTGTVSVGYNTWICPKVTLTRNAVVGSHCIVGSNSVVIGEVPDGSMASGVPAQVRPLVLPWPASP